MSIGNLNKPNPIGLQPLPGSSKKTHSKIYTLSDLPQRNDSTEDFAGNRKIVELSKKVDKAMVLLDKFKESRSNQINLLVKNLLVYSRSSKPDVNAILIKSVDAISHAEQAIQKSESEINKTDSNKMTVSISIVLLAVMSSVIYLLNSTKPN